jgi:hypothetical protein
MSKKSVPFKLAPRPVVVTQSVLALADRKSQAAGAESWIHRPREKDRSDVLEREAPRQSLFVLHDDPNWFDVVYACAILPSFTYWLWMLKGYNQMIRDR